MVTILPDGSAFAILEFPLPENHWLFEKGEFEVPPMTMRTGTDSPKRKELEKAIESAVKYALRVSIESPDEVGFDPDALVRNVVVGMLGYYTPNGLSKDAWANPKESPQHECTECSSTEENPYSTSFCKDHQILLLMSLLDYLESKS